MPLRPRLTEMEIDKFAEVSGNTTVRVSNSDGTILSAGGTSMADDAAFTVGASSVTPIGALVDETATDSADEGDIGAPRMTADRKLLTRLVGATDGNRADVDASGHLQVDIAASSVTVTVDSELTTADLDTGAGTDTRAVVGLALAASGGALLVGAANPVPVSDNAGSLTVDNAGTFAVQDATAQASLSVIDDWDESDRAKVNVIVGQAGIAGGTGVDGATVPRVTLATNVALPAGTNAIGKLAANSGVDIGDVDVTSSVSGTLDHGSNLDIDTVAEQITATSFAAKFGVVFKADIANTGTLYLGNSDVTAGTTAATDGIPLGPGESILLPVSNANLVYAIASANNQKIYWIGV